MKRTGKRRRRWRIALFVGIPLLALIVTVLVFLLFSRGASNETIPVEPKAIPVDWLAPTPSAQSESVTRPRDTEKPPSSREQPLFTDRAMSGVLSVIGNGKRFGEESYELRISSEGSLRMTSRGTFSFKVLFATVKATFSQNLFLDRNLRPGHYALHIDGPVGIGSRTVDGTVVGNVARVTSGDAEEETKIGDDTPLVLGTFSTYAFIPLLFRLLANEGAAQFQVIPLLRGKGKGGDAKEGDRAIILHVERAGDELIRSGASEVLADKYILVSDIANSILLAKGDEFLALIATSDKGSLIAYRSDYFPEGVDLP